MKSLNGLIFVFSILCLCPSDCYVVSGNRRQDLSIDFAYVIQRKQRISLTRVVASCVHVSYDLSYAKCLPLLIRHLDTGLLCVIVYYI